MRIVVRNEQLSKHAHREQLHAQEKKRDTIDHGGSLMEQDLVHAGDDPADDPLGRQERQPGRSQHRRAESHGAEQMLRTLPEAGDD